MIKCIPETTAMNNFIFYLDKLKYYFYKL